jgi:hypothetical protein
MEETTYQPDDDEVANRAEDLAGELEVPDKDFVDEVEANQDETIDNVEQLDEPASDLPEGARAEDYDNE